MKRSPTTPHKRFASTRTLTILGALLIVGVAAAAITLTYTTTSTLTTSVTPPPVQFVAGSDSGPSALTNYVTAYAISTNKTYMTATVKGVPEATLIVGSFFQLTNVDASSVHSVTLTTTQVSNVKVTTYTIAIYNGTGDTLMGTLDLTAASPTVTFSAGPSATYYGKITLTLATGAGLDNVALSNALTLTTV
ncbi:MAG: hypothetical protein WDA16_14755 [Candidatus Thermoplasmatota archaeon]